LPRRCQGYSQAPTDSLLTPCPYDALIGDYCHFHQGVVDGLIAPLSWSPTKAAKDEPARTPLERLRAEWDLGEAV
jgi:hypothetical protein